MAVTQWQWQKWSSHMQHADVVAQQKLPQSGDLAHGDNKAHNYMISQKKH